MFELSHQLLSARDRRVSFVRLAIFSSPLLAAWFYNHGQQVPFLVCPLKYLTGIPCPGCGLTRSFIAIVRGDWQRAIEQNIFGPIVFASFGIATIHLAIELVTKRHLNAFYTKLIGEQKIQLLGLFMVLLYHSHRLHNLSKSGELSAAFFKSPLGNLLF
ncbi:MULTISPECIES: DUF2752 domain-containing protein [Aerosakkonema]|uniref:DUF2752 domain-containing protein n=1 Tax=Aerosakkonema TaxID=1246629 RepID=UPI0035B9317D